MEFRAWNKVRRRRALAAATLAALLVASLALVDAAIASRTERALSLQAVLRDNLPTAPDVYIGGFPFLAAVAADSVPAVRVSSLDVPVDGVGVVNASAEAFDVDIPGDKILAADFTGGEATLVRRKIRLDGVAFGALLGMTDLDIANPYDISPRGGVASQAQLMGTVPDTDTPATVVVTLRLTDGVFEMRPSKLVDVAPEDTERVLDAFTLTLDTRDFPLGGPAGLVQLSGGSIEFSRDRMNVTLSPEDFTPLATPADL
ncbi:DUF2993 domain-containing protein [Corynebacterium sp.]|uniref:LmeA family phospholipid-binding protein n=1 Tax=Corynebacterium sp. TaxID=1720 RepID=UPI002A90DFE8|nr:DUF2993 domain-containing protein [Corynebacterium sp.]MDY5786087.1 DUF2993 domain-containing protein [Corynebacterium sp.]